jgi:DNA/RNA-binding domain of Phe-tRNA-synthetase-like protein
MLTENTKNAFMCIELIDENRTKEFENALKDLEKQYRIIYGNVRLQFLILTIKK